ncbi:LAFA_0F00914g1_1 [Lachancea sp. 'fantastica']|nr:LAFA_0F00914g1_1 [Lachancea sp. 'fantastica']
MKTGTIRKDGKPKDTRRAKTFTGCWTCRARKIKCDLRTPGCARCEKSGFRCGGYDIKLQWSQPIQFNAYGQVVQNTNTAGSSAGSDEPSSQRRDIAFVRYKEEYEYYEDMDEELSMLHSPPLNRIADNQTWVIKKFAVFRGTDKVKVKHVPRRQRRRVFDRLESKSDSSKSATRAGNKPLELLGTKDASVSSTLSHSDLVDKFEAEPTIQKTSSVANLFNFDFSSANFKGHEWISDELRDDALLSAYAMQGFAGDGANHLQHENCQQTSLANTPLRSTQDLFDDQFSQSGSVEKEDLSQVYKILFHRNEDRSRPKKVSTNLTVGNHTKRKSTVVPLNNIILIDSAGSEGCMPREVLEVVPSEVPDPSIFNLPNNNNPLLRVPTTGLKSNGLTRFLLNYYLQNVVDLMTVVALPTNPWRTIYFPRALQALGDLAGIGYTSNSRNSLLNAILAVSCFNLQSKFPKNSPQMKYFLHLGIELRGQASEFLKTCLNSTVKEERYKDIVTAILSMNSIDVVWGTMADCQYHLSLCEELVEERMKSRPKISEKARSLHRIFSFLKLIQDSTALDKVTEKEIVLKNTASEDSQENEEEVGSPDIGGGEFKEALDQVNGRIRIEYVRLSNSNASTPIFTDIASQNYYYPHGTTKNNSILSTDALYGLPNSIILLFSDCVRLARHLEYFRTHSQEIPKSFDALCTSFEAKLFNWTSEWDFHKPDTDEFLNDTVEGVYHHTMSFYQSLIIYYRTRVKNCPNSEVQINVVQVLSHLDKLAGLIETKGISIVPLIWQGFMAGCAAVDTELQLRFKEWAAKLADSGMGAYWGARQIMFEVWRRRVNGETSDNWFDVYKDWEMNLMLS